MEWKPLSYIEGTWDMTLDQKPKTIHFLHFEFVVFDLVWVRSFNESQESSEHVLTCGISKCLLFEV